MARVLFYWCLLHHGYDFFEFLALSAVLRDAPAAYGRAFLQVATDDNDLTYFITHQLGALERAHRAFHDFARRQAAERREVATRISATATTLNHRQLAILAHALSHPSGRRYTLPEHTRSHRLSRQTARNDFTALVRLGLFEETKSGKTLAFFPAPALLEITRQSAAPKTHAAPPSSASP